MNPNESMNKTTIGIILLIVGVIGLVAVVIKLSWGVR